MSKISEYSIFAVPENPYRNSVTYFYCLKTPRTTKHFVTYEDAKQAFDKMKKPIFWFLNVRKADGTFSLIRSWI